MKIEYPRIAVPTASKEICVAAASAGKEKTGSRVPRVKGYSVKNLPFHSPRAVGRGMAVNRKGTAIHTYTSQGRRRPKSQPLPRENIRGGRRVVRVGRSRIPQSCQPNMLL